MSDFETIKKRAREHFADTKGSHAWDHTLRVLHLAEHIAADEGADMRVVRFAALLHDIGRPEQDASGGKVCHATEGAKKAREILSDEGVDEDVIQMVVHCVEAHRGRGDMPPRTLEAKVVYDADKLDSIGAVGIGRAFLFSGEVGGKLHDKDVDVEKTVQYSADDTAYREYLVKLRYVKDVLFTKEGKRLAADRQAFMEAFFERLNKEVDGKL